ncbi:HET-domain-containing protein, partial [Parathielavia hyrcaniae]
MLCPGVAIPLSRVDIAAIILGIESRGRVLSQLMRYTVAAREPSPLSSHRASRSLHHDTTRTVSSTSLSPLSSRPPVDVCPNPGWLASPHTISSLPSAYLQWHMLFASNRPDRTSQEILTPKQARKADKMPVTLPRSGALPLSATGKDMVRDLLRSVSSGVFRTGVLLYFFPLRDYPASFHLFFSLVYWACRLIALYTRSMTNRGEATSHGDLHKTLLQAVGFFCIWLALGPAWTAAYWILLFFLGLWGGRFLVIGLGLAAAWLEKRASEWLMVATARQGLGQLSLWWDTFLILVHRTILFGIDDAGTLMHTLCDFTLPWCLRRMGERWEATGRPRQWENAVQTSYEYDKLDHTRKQIRLLRIPRQRLFWGHLRCTLVAASMEDEVPTFEALSYRWGFANTSQTAVVFVNGRSMRIPSSAYQLLHACSSTWTDRLVWIDAICINQADDQEKSQQLPLMRDIYSRAKKVVVWPGDELDSNMALWTIKRVLSASLHFEAPEEEMRDFFDDEWDRRAWRSMTKLFENPYFTRMWVVQEVVLGSNVEIHHGGRSLSWDAFSQVALQCIQPRRRTMLYGPKPASLARERALQDAMEGIGLMSLFRMVAEDGELGRLHIGHLLLATAKSQASNPRDKVFALSGLLSGKSSLPTSLLDYSKPAAEVFLETSRVVLEQERDPFILLGFAGIGWDAGSSDWPSWAVDWSRGALQTPLSAEAYLLKGQPADAPAAKRPIVRVLTVRSGSPRLLVCGTVIERIHKDVAAAVKSSATDAATSRVQTACERSRWYLEAEKLVRFQDGAYPCTRQSLREAFWQIVVADTSMAQQPAPAYFGDCNKIFRELSVALLQVYAGKSQEPLLIGDHPELSEIWPTKLDKEAEFSEFRQAIGAAAENRKFIVSESGLLGLAPPLSQPGDLICLFDGAPTPFLLRERQSEVGTSDSAYWASTIPLGEHPLARRCRGQNIDGWVACVAWLAECCEAFGLLHSAPNNPIFLGNLPIQSIQFNSIMEILGSIQSNSYTVI